MARPALGGEAGGRNLPPPWDLLSTHKLLNVNRFHLDHAGVSRPRIKEGLHNHRPRREFGEVRALEVFGHRVVEIPQCGSVELWVARSLELLRDGIHIPRRKCLAFSELHREGARIVESDLGLLVAVDPRFHVRPVRQEATNRLGQHAGNIAEDIRCVTAGELDVRRETKVLTDDHAVAHTDACRKGAIMRVAQSQNQLAFAAVDVRPSNLEPAKVALTETAQGVFLFAHGVARTIQSFQGLIDQKGMCDRGEGLSRIRRADGCEFFTGDDVFCNDHFLIRLMV
jgi:hypothetical protein